MNTGRGLLPKMKRRQMLKRLQPGGGALEKDLDLGPSQIMANWPLGVSQYQKILLLWSLKWSNVQMTTMSLDCLLSNLEPAQ